MAIQQYRFINDFRCIKINFKLYREKKLETAGIENDNLEITPMSSSSG